jgi:hypothetical protein
MRLRKTKQILIIISLLLGVISLGVAFFAYQLGLDNNQVMGIRRKILAGFGSLLLFLTLIAPIVARFIYRSGASSAYIRFTNNLQNSTFVRKIDQALLRFKATRFCSFTRTQPLFWTILACVMVAFIALWYNTSGTLTQWTPYSRYFDREADAFLAGSLSLLEEPPQELSQLQDPYDLGQREGIHYLWDASYYNGKYYYYWGPVPAVVAAGIKAVSPGVIEDQVLVYIFYNGLVLSFAALLFWLYKRYFSNAPAWMLFWLVLVVGFATPVFWLISRPSVYETAIASAQCFLLLGLYAAVRGLASIRLRVPWLILSGVAWGAAVGSRFTYSVAVIALSLLVIWVLSFKDRRFKIQLKPILAFLTPLAFFLVALCWFNYARFGSIFETGMRFQLTGDALPDDFSLLMSPAYILPNFYLEFFHPYIFTSGEFPFFIVPYYSDVQLPTTIYIPRNYSIGEPIVGILYSMPLLFMLIPTLFSLFRKYLHWFYAIPTETDAGAQPVPWWVWALLVSGFVFTLLPLMIYVLASMRFLADFVPTLLLLISAVFMNDLIQNRSKVWRTRLLSTVFVILCALTISIGLLVNFGGWSNRIETNNPHLYWEISHFFGNE